jgi:type I restriction enzyme S subunit
MSKSDLKVQLGVAPLQILDGDRGKEYPGQSDYLSEGFCLFLNTGNVRQNGFEFLNCQFVSEDRDRRLRKGKLQRGDVVMTTRGTVGHVGLYDDRVPYQNIRINSGMVILRPDQTHLLPNFLFHVVRSPYFRSQVKALTSGAAQPQFPIRDIKLVEIMVPPIPIQHRIASILGAYDDLIEVNRRRNAILEEMARRLFDEWFVHFRFPGHEGHRMVETEHGRLPEGWRWETFGNLCADVRDTVAPTQVDAATPYIGLEHIPRQSTTLDAFGRADEVTSTKHRFHAGDVLFGKIRPYFHKVAWAPFDGVCSSDAIVIRAKQRQTAGVVLAVASSDRFVATAVQTSNGTKMPRANWGVLARYPVAIPPKRLFTLCSDSIIRWATLASKLQTVSVNLANSRDLLLPRLISGELSVAAAERELDAAA